MSNVDLTQLLTAADKIATARATRYAALAHLRWQRETGGLTLPDGADIVTTREGQAQIAGAVQSITAGLMTGPIDWKLASGWQQLAPDQMLSIARAVIDHVKCCFAAERVVASQMDAAPDYLLQP